MVEYPGIARACLLIALDNGGINRYRSVETQKRDMERWLAKLPADILPPIDAWLAALSDEDLDTFCCGGEDESETKVIRATAPPFTDQLLNDYFAEVC